VLGLRVRLAGWGWQMGLRVGCRMGLAQAHLQGCNGERAAALAAAKQQPRPA